MHTAHARVCKEGTPLSQHTHTHLTEYLSWPANWRGTELLSTSPSWDSILAQRGAIRTGNFLSHKRQEIGSLSHAGQPLANSPKRHTTQLPSLRAFSWPAQHTHPLRTRRTLAGMVRRSMALLARARRGVQWRSMTAKAQQQQQQRQVEMGEVMWSPSPQRVLSSRMVAFAKLASERSERDLRRYDYLWYVACVRLSARQALFVFALDPPRFKKSLVQLYSTAFVETEMSVLWNLFCFLLDEHLHVDMCYIVTTITSVS